MPLAAESMDVSRCLRHIWVYAVLIDTVAIRLNDTSLRFITYQWANAYAESNSSAPR